MESRERASAGKGVRSICSGVKMIQLGRLMWLGLACAGSVAWSQRGAPDRSRLLAVAREVMRDAGVATLVTLDAAGHPQARTVDPFAPEGEMTIWIGTNPRTRKVAELRRDPRATLHYFDPRVRGYVTLQGAARVVTDSAEKAARFKPEWTTFYRSRERDYALIRFDVHRLEVVSPNHGVTGDSLRWRPPSVNLRRRP